MSDKQVQLYRPEAVATRYEHYWGRLHRHQSCSLTMAILIFTSVIAILTLIFGWIKW